MRITICMGSSCFARGNEKNLELAEEYLELNGFTDSVEYDLSGSLCEGRCAEGPIVCIDNTVYTRVDPGAMMELLRKHIPAKGGAR